MVNMVEYEAILYPMRLQRSGASKTSLNGKTMDWCFEWVSDVVERHRSIQVSKRQCLEDRQSVFLSFAYFGADVCCIILT